ncbi:MAG: hypothetical protein WC430_02485 [Patescibacteria group bacterium]
MRKKVILGAIGILILGVAFIFYSYDWFLGKQERVLTGTARPEFPYNDYTIDEMNKMYPQEIDYNSIATVQTPEETYAKLKEYLINGNNENVLSLFSPKNKEIYKKEFEEVKKNNKLNEVVSMLKDIKKDENNCFDGRCTYIMQDENKSEIDFIKTSQGVWLIDSL